MRMSSSMFFLHSKKYTTHYLFSILTFFLIGCQSYEILPGSERIRVFDAEPKGCLYVGEVSSVQEASGIGTLETEMNLETRIDLRNKAHKLGGNILVFLKGKSTNTLPGTKVSNPGSGKASAAKTTEAAGVEKNTKESETSLVFLATVFKCPSSILNQ